MPILLHPLRILHLRPPQKLDHHQQHQRRNRVPYPNQLQEQLSNIHPLKALIIHHQQKKKQQSQLLQEMYRK